MDISLDKQAKSHKRRPGHVIHWELCDKFQFDYKNKWYMHNPESVQENESHSVLLGFVIQADNLISALMTRLSDN